MTRQRRLNQSRYNRDYYQRNAEAIRAKRRVYMAARRAAQRNGELHDVS